MSSVTVNHAPARVRNVDGSADLHSPLLGEESASLSDMHTQVGLADGEEGADHGGNDTEAQHPLLVDLQQDVLNTSAGGPSSVSPAMIHGTASREVIVQLLSRSTSVHHNIGAELSISDIQLPETCGESSSSRRDPQTELLQVSSSAACSLSHFPQPVRF